MHSPQLFMSYSEIELHLRADRGLKSLKSEPLQIFLE